MLAPLLWSPPERYVRFEEGIAGGAVGAGSYGKVHSSYDKLLQQHVMVKRQPLQQGAFGARALGFSNTARFPTPERRSHVGLLRWLS